MLSLFFISLPSFAEYRAYQYIVKDPMQPDIEPSIITTANQPNLYKSLHGNNLDITLVNTWMCHGYTSRKKICDYPFTVSTEEIGIKAKAGR